MEVLIRTHVLLYGTQKHRLRVLAADEQTSMASLVREAVNHYLAVVAGPAPRERRLAALRAVGMLPVAPTPDEGEEPMWPTGSGGMSL